jgi:hypothetical protein
MWHKHSVTLTSAAVAALLTAALSWPAQAAEVWRVNVEKSKFSSSTNTLVLDRFMGKPSAQIVASGNPAAGTFLVIAGGKVYLAADQSADAWGTGIKTVDYTRWMDMKLVQIGDHVRSLDYCSFRCQAGLADRRKTLSFIAKGGDPSERMRDLVVYNEK